MRWAPGLAGSRRVRGKGRWCIRNAPERREGGCASPRWLAVSGAAHFLPTPPGVASPGSLPLLLVTKHGSDSSYLMLVVPPLSPLSSGPRLVKFPRGTSSVLGFSLRPRCQTRQKGSLDSSRLLPAPASLLWSAQSTSCNPSPPKRLRPRRLPSLLDGLYSSSRRVQPTTRNPPTSPASTARGSLHPLELASPRSNLAHRHRSQHHDGHRRLG